MKKLPHKASSSPDSSSINLKDVEVCLKRLSCSSIRKASKPATANKKEGHPAEHGPKARKEKEARGGGSKMGRQGKKEEEEEEEECGDEFVF